MRCDLTTTLSLGQRWNMVDQSVGEADASHNGDFFSRLCFKYQQNALIIFVWLIHQPLMNFDEVPSSIVSDRFAQFPRVRAV